MRNSNNAYIGVGLSDDKTMAIPMIHTSGTNGLQKKITGLPVGSELHIYHMDMDSSDVDLIGTVKTPEDVTATALLSYKPSGKTGTVRIVETGTIWSFDLDPVESPSVEKVERSIPIVDLDKVKQLEEEEQNNPKKILWADDLETELNSRIFGQEDAIHSISLWVASNLKRKNAEILNMVLFGPTGVGKTELGKQLPKALEKLTGQKYGFIEESLNTFKNEATVTRFTGSSAGYTGYGDSILFAPIREQPYTIVLLNELDKAHPAVLESLMEVLSNGYFTPADNSPAIDMSHVIMIFTTNLPIDMEAYNAANKFDKPNICRNALAEHCGRPEIAGRIEGCVAFQNLTSDVITQIICKAVREEAENYDMNVVHLDEALLLQLKSCRNQFGVRGVKLVVKTAISDRMEYDRNFEQYRGKDVCISGDIEDIQIRVA